MQMLQSILGVNIYCLDYITWRVTHKTQQCVVWCGVVWCGVVWCGVVWCGVVWCGVVWRVKARGIGWIKHVKSGGCVLRTTTEHDHNRMTTR